MVGNAQNVARPLVGLVVRLVVWLVMRRGLVGWRREEGLAPVSVKVI